MVSSVLQEDLQAIAGTDTDLSPLDGSTVLITGGTGFIGSLLVRSMLEIRKRRQLNVRILAQIRDKKKAAEIYGDEEKNVGLSFVCGDICEPISVTENIDYIIHTAGVTTSKTMAAHPAETIDTAIFGTRNVLRMACEKNVKKLLYLSSMEMYGDVGARTAHEDVLGYIDLSRVRSCYPESKRMCECMLQAWSQEYSVPFCTARLAQIIGPGVHRGENRVFVQFARSAMEGRDIILYTSGMSEGNYCYSADAVKALILLLLNGQDREAYNVVNETTHMRICDMAEMVADHVAGGQIKVIREIPEESQNLGYAADVHLKLSAGKLRKLGWKPEVNLQEAYKRLICYMRETGM